MSRDSSWQAANWLQAKLRFSAATNAQSLITVVDETTGLATRLFSAFPSSHKPFQKASVFWMGQQAWIYRGELFFRMQLVHYFPMCLPERKDYPKNGMKREARN